MGVEEVEDDLLVKMLVHFPSLKILVNFAGRLRKKKKKKIAAGSPDHQ